MSNAKKPKLFQKCYNGVRLLEGAGPCLANVERISLGAIPVLSFMQNKGMQVDLDHFAKMHTTLEQRMEEITEDVRAMTGKYINIDSGDQVAELLFRHLGLKQARPKMTPSGDRESVEDQVLNAIQHDHPVVPKLQEFKEYSKLDGTYVVPMPKLAQRTAFGVWRMFPKLSQTRIPSMRLNCKEPNLLAMPTRTEMGREIRKGFIAGSGRSIVSVDESQIEPRISAHRSKDPGLLKIYQNGEDIYSDFSISAFKLPDKRYFDADAGKWKYPGVETMEHRRPCKTCVLAAFYRVTPEGLLEQMPIVCKGCNKEATKHDCSKFISLWNESNCQDLINAFFIKYSGLIKMMKADDVFVRRNAYQVDMWGNILHVQAVRSVLDWVVSQALREAGNFPIQSSAQGTIKLVMAQTWDDFEQAGMLDDIVWPLLQVHDELLFEARNDYIEEIGAHVVDRFENCVRLDVPIKAGIAVADSWGGLEK